MKKTFILALLAAVSMTSCTKTKDKNSGANSATTEKLGELKPDLYSSPFFLKDGRPAVPYSDNFYAWNAAAKTWEKIAPAHASSAGFTALVQDNQGTYFGAAWQHIYMLNKATGSWDTLAVGNYRGSVSQPSLIINKAGDIVIRIMTADTSYYFKKPASATDWTKIAQRPTVDEKRNYPYYLCDNGNLYFGYEASPYPRGTLCDVVLNTNTGTFGLLFDKSDIDNATVLGGSSNAGTVSAGYISSDGVVYVMYETYTESWKATLYRLTPTSLPAKFEKVQKFNLPQPPENGSGWFTTVSSPFVVNSKGDIKMLFNCTKYPDAHWSLGTANANSPNTNYFNHGQGQQQICPNLNGDVYISVFNGNIYKW